VGDRKKGLGRVDMHKSSCWGPEGGAAREEDGLQGA